MQKFSDFKGRTDWIESTETVEYKTRRRTLTLSLQDENIERVIHEVFLKKQWEDMSPFTTVSAYLEQKEYLRQTRSLYLKFIPQLVSATIQLMPDEFTLGAFRTMTRKVFATIKPPTTPREKEAMQRFLNYSDRIYRWLKGMNLAKRVSPGKYKKL